MVAGRGASVGVPMDDGRTVGEWRQTWDTSDSVRVDTDDAHGWSTAVYGCTELDETV